MLRGTQKHIVSVGWGGSRVKQKQAEEWACTKRPQLLGLGEAQRPPLGQTPKQQLGELSGGGLNAEPSSANIPSTHCKLRADSAELTWLAKMRDILVLSLGFLVMWRMSCNMGVMPTTQ